jgi:hypothetical protein
VRGYDELVVRSPQGSLFASSWWLEAVAPGRWRTHAVERDGAVVAAWPTIVRKSRWGEVHEGAPITPYLGPILSGGAGVHRRRSREAEQLEQLLAELGRFAHIEARCGPEFDYWTPLHWHGFSQTTHYTWRLPDLTDLEAVFGGLRENLRREIRKAGKLGIVVEDGTLGDYLRLHELGAERQDRLGEAQANRRVIERVDDAAAGRGAREILVARDGDGRLHSGAFFVHDAAWTYYLLGGSDPQHRTTGAASLVMWSAIERAAARGTGFDFEGSMLRPVERFVRAWGGEPTPYSIVRKTPSRGFAAERTARRAARRVVRS